MISDELGYAESVAECASALLWFHLDNNVKLKRTYQETLEVELLDMREL